MRSSLLQTLYRFVFRPYSSLSDPRQQEIDTPPNAPSPGPFPYLWFGFSLAIALLYSTLALSQTLSSDYVVQDDARQHVFWMARFVDPALFPNDLIADYFQSVAPAGYQLVYQIAAWLGISPLFFHKLIPVGLNLLTAGLCFRVSLWIFPIPSAAFCSTVLLGQGLGLTDAIVSGTPKAFIYPLFLLFMDGLLRQSWWTTWLAVMLEGLFYPQLVLISAGVLCLQLVAWTVAGGERLRFVQGSDRQQHGKSKLILCLGGLLVAGLVLLPYAIQTSVFGPTLSLTDARQLPELAMEGSRSRFFYDGDPAAYWLNGRSGLRLATIFTPVTNLLGLGLLGLPWFAQTSLLKKYIQPSITLLTQVIVSSLGCFFLAHLLLFRLHLPSRYTQHSLRIVASLAAGTVIVSLLHTLWTWAQMQASSLTRTIRKVGAGAIAISLTATVLGYPLLVGKFPLTGYQHGRYEKLYTFLQEQPPATVIASLANEANNLPTFTHRSILTGSEYAIPYHVGYYRQLRQRTVDLITAQYSTDKKAIKRFIKDYGITLWLLDKGAFKPKYIQNNAWIQQHPQAALSAFSNMQGKKRPPLLRVMQSCQVLEDKTLVLIDAQCVSETL